MKEPFEDPAARRRALERAQALSDRGVARVDFLYSHYHDECQLLGSKAFDADGRMLPSEEALTGWSEAVPLTVPGWEPGDFCSYSPRHHQVTSVGDVDWRADADDPDDQMHVLVLDTAYEEVTAALTWHPDLPHEVMEQSVRAARTSVRAAIAANPTLPEALQAVLANDAAREVRVALAGNPGLASAVARGLSADVDVHYALATNPNAPGDVLSSLVPDDAAVIERAFGRSFSYDSKSRAINNPRFPRERLEGLWRPRPDNAVIAAALAGHPQVTEDLVETLSRHPDARVRSALCANAPPALTLPMIRDLIARSDPHDRYAHWALAQYDFSTASGRREIAGLLADPDDLIARRIHGFLAQNTTIPPELFEKLPQDSWVRGCLTSNPSTPGWLLQDIANAPDGPEAIGRYYVDQARARVLPWLPPAALAAEIASFAESADWADRVFAAQQTAATADALVSLLRHEGLHGHEPGATLYDRERVWQALSENPRLPVAALAEHGTVQMRCWAAWKRSTPEDLAALASDSDRAVRKLVARNPHTPPDVLARLAEDAEASVRDAVLENVATPRDRMLRSPLTAAEQAKHGTPATETAPEGASAPPRRMSHGRIALFVVSVLLLLKASCGLLSSFTSR